MMYLTAMRLNSRREGIGVNIFLHQKEGVPDAQNPWAAVNSPGAPIEAVSRREVRSGGNSVEGFLDILLDEHLYSKSLLLNVMEQAASQIETGRSNPAKMTLGGQDPVYVAFSVNLGLEDLMSKRHVFQQLRDAVTRWLDKHDETIQREIHGLHRAAG
jgi:hypothetical protein